MKSRRKTCAPGGGKFLQYEITAPACRMTGRPEPVAERDTNWCLSGSVGNHGRILDLCAITAIYLLIVNGFGVGTFMALVWTASLCLSYPPILWISRGLRLYIGFWLTCSGPGATISNSFDSGKVRLCDSTVFASTVSKASWIRPIWSFAKG